MTPPPCYFFLLEGEDHEIGLLLANSIAKKMGWHTYYLGQNVPTENVKILCDQVKPTLMFSMFISPRSSKFGNTLETLLESVDTPFIYSGKANFTNNPAIQPLALYLDSPEKLVNHLKNHHTHIPPSSQNI